MFGAGSGSLEPANRNEVGDHEGTARSEPTLPRKAGVKGRHCLLTTGGLIGVSQRFERNDSITTLCAMPDLRSAWDARKNAANRKKHGISFEEAQTVF